MLKIFFTIQKCHFFATNYSNFDIFQKAVGLNVFLYINVCLDKWVDKCIFWNLKIRKKQSSFRVVFRVVFAFFPVFLHFSPFFAFFFNFFLHFFQKKLSKGAFFSRVVPFFPKMIKKDKKRQKMPQNAFFRITKPYIVIQLYILRFFYGLMKKSLQKKAPLERFFSQKFFEIGQMDIFEMSKIENRKKVCTKNRSKGAFF